MDVHRQQGRWTTKRAIYASGALLVWVPACLLAAWWQVHVALAGDSLGWVYSIEWPVFAAFGVCLWWFLVHDEPDAAQRRRLSRRQHATAAATELQLAQRRVLEDEDEELRAYNDYLASLRIQDEAKASRRRKSSNSAP